ncbi:MAG: exodeoxyribonuclease VII large subunit [Chitinophagales bacterium]
MIKDSAKVLDVSEFIEVLNSQLRTLQAKVHGEVTQVKVWSSGHVYFTIKDMNNGDVLNCVMWKSRYNLASIEIENGLELILQGRPNVYGPNGSLSFIADKIELVGEGALMKAYLKLKEKLTKEGLFDNINKRALPEFPVKIGVITSSQGAVIHDFTNNLKQIGFQVKLLHSPVEGQESGPDLCLAVRQMRNVDIDVLVLIRGGGSVQSLAGFDNEALVREIARFPVPVIAGVGHHEDIPLAALAADLETSTPSLAAKTLNETWDRAELDFFNFKQRILNGFERAVSIHEREMQSRSSSILSSFRGILRHFEDIQESIPKLINKFSQHLFVINSQIKLSRKNIIKNFENLLTLYQDKLTSLPNKRIIPNFNGQIQFAESRLRSTKRIIQSNNPERLLKLGYGIAYHKDAIVKSVSQVEKDEKVTLKLFDGNIDTIIKNITNKHHDKEKNN